MEICEGALLCKSFLRTCKKTDTTKKPRAYCHLLSDLLSVSGLVLQCSFLPHCRFSMNYQKSMGAVKHSSIPYHRGCMSTYLAVGFCGGTYVRWGVCLEFHGLKLQRPGRTSLFPDLSGILCK